jgi:hypothetical protein
VTIYKIKGILILTKLDSDKDRKLYKKKGPFMTPPIILKGKLPANVYG